MVNLAKAYDIAVIKGKFFYSVNGKKVFNDQNPFYFTLCDNKTRVYHGIDRVNFDANLKAFLLENAEILTDLDYGIKIDFMRGSNVFYFSIIFV